MNSVPMHHTFGMSTLTTSRLLIVCKTSRNAKNIAIFESLFDYMDHDNCPLTFFKALLNILGGMGAISNINY